ncbi:MAG: PaaI family thioesterase [Euryarchaeota archaeon]|nr:PaaI family thioesterase [Euryarchaeota archaeon]
MKREGGLPGKVRRILQGKSPPPPYMQVMGMRITRCGGGRARVEMEAGERLYNLADSVHGGVASGLADTAMGQAIISTLNPGESFTTMELKINFLRPVFRGRLVSDGWVVHRGSRVVMAEADVKGSGGKLVARATSTCLILEPKDARE